MEPDGTSTWRLHLLLSEGGQMAFNFAALNPGERTLTLEQGARSASSPRRTNPAFVKRLLIAGSLQPRPSDAGGQGVRITIRGALPQLPDVIAEAFPGVVAKAESIFDIARVFATASAKRGEYWSQGPSSASKPPLAVRPCKSLVDDGGSAETTPPWQSPAPFDQRERSDRSSGRPKSPAPAASFQDLVLLNRSESTTEPMVACGALGGGGGFAPSPSPSPSGVGGAARSGSTARSSLEILAKQISAGLTIDAAAEADESKDRFNSGGEAGLPSPCAVGPLRSPVVNRRMSAIKADSTRPASSGAGTSERRRLALIMVGLPARGKTFTAQKLARYLNWLGHETRHFNVGKYRRDFVGSSCTAEFFSAGNTEAVASRNEVARMALEDMLRWMESGGQVGIFDATNSTVGRRAMVTETLRGKCKIIFLETVCTDRSMIERNVLEKIHHSPDYVGVDPETAKADFMSRMLAYENSYEPLGDNELQWASSIHVIDIASGAGTLQVSRIQGYLPGRIVYFLLNAHLSMRPIFFCRHGKSEDNEAGKIGGDSKLSGVGSKFSERLRAFLEALPPHERPCAIWTSTLKRTVMTAAPLHGWPRVQWRALDEIDAGACDGMTYDEIRETMPSEFEARLADKLRYRYPRGESYLDVIARLEPVTIELERQRAPVLIIAHQAVLRCLSAYFMSKKVEEVPHLDMPLHTVVKIAPSSYGVQEERFPLMPEGQMPVDEARTPPHKSAASREQHEFSR